MVLNITLKIHVSNRSEAVKKGLLYKLIQFTQGKTATRNRI